MHKGMNEVREEGSNEERKENEWMIKLMNDLIGEWMIKLRNERTNERTGWHQLDGWMNR